MNRRQRWTCRAFVITWLAGTAFFWVWWVNPEHVTTTAGMLGNSLLLGSLTLVPAWAFYFIARASAPARDAPLPLLRVAMVTTKVPKEPWPLVQRTLEAMLHQEYPYSYDVWLADEAPSGEVLAWCGEHGVSVISRLGIAAYNRPTYPRKARTKEGNLAYFYDQVGYSQYDVVVQFDADHAPSPRYLRDIMPPFANPQVGYVAAPSICDGNSETSWSTRGRLFCEGSFHGPAQAGCNGGYGPSCIGSHYAVRMTALRDIGGLGPELAEDFSTSLIFNAYGWEGVYSIHAEAHGDGPESVADCVIQDFQWARSVLNVLLRYRGILYWRGLSLRGRFRLGFCLVWYPLYALQMFAGVLLPIVALATKTPLVNVALSDFLVHATPAAATLIGFGFWLRRNSWLRPAHAPVLSWEVALFQLVRWPWVLIGCGASFAGWLLRREFTFTVTPKRVHGLKPLPLVILLPYLILAAAPALAVLLIPDPGAARGYYFWALFTSVCYLVVVMAVVGLHVSENRQRSGAPRRTRARVSAALAACASAVVGTGLALHGTDALHAFDSRGAPQPIVAVVVEAAQLTLGEAPSSGLTRIPSAGVSRPPVTGAGRGVEFGVTTQRLTTSAGAPWAASDLASVRSISDATRAPVRIVEWFADWAHTPLDTSHLASVAQIGAESEITWEPWNSADLTSAQSEYTLRSIIDGRHDDYIARWALAIRDFGGPVRIRFAQEMNGVWYPWAERVNGNQPGEFGAAWRHVHDIFTAVGAVNAEWVWAPFDGDIDPEMYPGDAYVDRLGLSGFNGGTTAPNYGGWRSFGEMFEQQLGALAAISPTKLVEISEVASAEGGGDKAAWTSDAFAQLKRFPQIATVIWFDVVKEADWRIDSSPAASLAFATAMADPYFRYAGPSVPLQAGASRGGSQ